MDSPLKEEQTRGLLDAGVDELLSVDDVIEQLCKIPSNQWRSQGGMGGLSPLQKGLSPP
jgi:hypothetical protein